MAAVLQSKQIAANQPAVTAGGAHDLVALVGDYELSAALVVNDLIEFVELPPGHVPVDVILDTPDLDSNVAPAVVVQVGLMAGNVGDTTLASRTTGAEFIAASTVAQAGGIARMAVAGGTRVAPSTSRRSIGLKVATAPATGATSGTIRLTVLARPQINGV